MTRPTPPLTTHRAPLLLLSLALGALSCERDGTPSDTAAPPSPREIHLDPPSPEARDPKSPASLPEKPAPIDLRLVQERARTGTAGDIPFLKRHLHATGEARRWAAFGLGRFCFPHHTGLAPLLASAFAAWTLSPEPLPALDVLTLTRALGQCGSPQAEELLRSWLGPNAPADIPELSEGVALGLGALADLRGRLEERTLTLLLDTTEREKNPSLLYPFTRLPRLSPALAQRTLDVTGELLTLGKHPGRRHAILTLGSVGPSATLPLTQIILKSEFPLGDRTSAVHALGRLGFAGQRALDQTLAEILERGLPSHETSELWPILRALLQLIDEPHKSRPALIALTTAPLPEPSTPERRASRRRLVALRCAAAVWAAQKDPSHKSLIECDPEPSRVSLEARLRVLGKSPLTGARAALYEELLDRAETTGPAALETALRLLPAHAEYPGTLELLARAVTHSSPGVRATAYAVLTAHPERAHTQGAEPAPDPRILKALGRELQIEDDALPPLETLCQALLATGALGALTLKPDVERHCRGARPALHPSATRALALLGNPGVTCASTGSGATVTTPAASTGESAPLILEIESDLGPLRLILEGGASPTARAQFLSLVRTGHYENTTIHAATPGFALQWGDPDGDGYDDGGTPALPDERGLEAWPSMSFGFTGFSKDALSSQILVLLSDAPQFTGQKTQLGRAEGPWHLLLPGDTLRKFTLR